MRIQYLFPLFLILVFVHFSSFAQQRKVDSLMGLLQKDDSIRNQLKKTDYDKGDSNRIKTLVNLSNEFRNIGSYDKARQYAETALAIAKKIGNRPMEAAGNYNIGMVYYSVGNTDEALKYFNEALIIRTELKDKKRITDINIMMGLLLINKAKYNEAIESFNSAIVIKKELNDQLGIANAYHNIGMASYYKGDYPRSLANYFEALKIREQLNDKRSILSSLVNIGVVYYAQGNLEDAKKNYETALTYSRSLGDKRAIAYCLSNLGGIFEKERKYAEAIPYYSESLKLAIALNDKVAISTNNFNLGSNYANRNQYDSALVYYNNSLKISEEIKDELGVSRALYCIGGVNISLKKYTEAKKYLDNALIVSRKIGAKENIVGTYGQLINLDSVTGNWRDAFTHYNEYFKFRDSMINSDNTAQLVKTKLKYEFEKKEDSTKAAQEKKELAYQKELALQNLRFEYQRKQAAAKSAQEKQQLLFEQQIKEQKINLDYNQKIALADVKQRNQIALNKALAQENELMVRNRKNEVVIRWLMIVALLSLIGFSGNYYLNFKKQKAANLQIAKQSNDLKELMQELHHRVKNNLQLISSLLELQSMRLTDDHAKQAFEEGQSRVQSIAILHQQLYQHDNITTIELSRFMDELFKQISAAFKKPDQQVNIMNALNEFYIDIEIALPLGLIINELATNSFKYANPANNQLQLSVGLKQIDDKKYTLIYTDNGIGMPQDFKLDSAQSLGMRIVSKLAKQIRGVSEYEYHDGAVFSISFMKNVHS